MASYTGQSFACKATSVASAPPETSGKRREIKNMGSPVAVPGAY